MASGRQQSDACFVEFEDPHSTQHTWRRYTDLLRDAFNPHGAGRGLFFSFDADITLTQQRCAISAMDKLCSAMKECESYTVHVQLALPEAADS